MLPHCHCRCCRKLWRVLCHARRLPERLCLASRAESYEAGIRANMVVGGAIAAARCTRGCWGQPLARAVPQGLAGAGDCGGRWRRWWTSCGPSHGNTPTHPPRLARPEAEQLRKSIVCSVVAQAAGWCDQGQLQQRAVTWGVADCLVWMHPSPGWCVMWQMRSQLIRMDSTSSTMLVYVMDATSALCVLSAHQAGQAIVLHAARWLRLTLDCLSPSLDCFV